MEYDLITLGLRLRDAGESDDFTWHDLAVIVRNLPAESALMRHVDPENVQWTLNNQLAAMTVDILRWLQWAKTKDGEKGRNMPKPIPRPGVEDDVQVTGRGEDMGSIIEWLGEDAAAYMGDLQITK